MPIEGQFLYEDGSVDNVKTTEPGQTFYALDFFAGRLYRVVGIECPLHDLYGIIHIVDDEEDLEHFCPANAAEFFTVESQKMRLPPNGSCEIEMVTRLGRCATLTMSHNLPYTRSYN